MALSKQIEHENGVVYGYHRVTSLNIITNQANLIEVGSYISAKQREKEQSWLEESRLRAELMARGEMDLTEEEIALLATEQAPSTVMVEAQILNTPYDQSMTVKDAYTWLKSLDEFSGAEDV